jgi:flagellar assembly protein FliH
VQLARQVLRSELLTQPDLVARVASEAVNGVLLSARHITVQVHPLDLPLVAEGAEEALKARGARLMPNKSIERGGVLVESDVGAIDARLATRWAQAAANLGSAEALDAPPDAPQEDAE